MIPPLFGKQEVGIWWVQKRWGVYCFTSVRPSFRPSILPSFRPSKIFFVAFFSVTVDGRNLIFGHKHHIGIRRHSTTFKKSSCFTTRTDGFIIEDVWFNALNYLEDIDIPANTTTQPLTVDDLFCVNFRLVVWVIVWSASESSWYVVSCDYLEDIDIPANTTTFTDYVTTQWIDGDRQVWNHFNTDGPHTTNHIEGWHNKLKKKVSHAHPNIYTLINTFKNIHAANEVNYI
jgi:hypothetical protein